MQLSQRIEYLSRAVPSLPPLPPKNFFDITGIRNKEVINSRVLSYFLNVKGEHGFGTLFFDALIALIDKKIDKRSKTISMSEFSGEFTVEEEEPTANALEKDDQKKRIDLVLKGKDGWAIIIENKLYHDVVNPLETYWNHLDNEYKKKVGVILSLFNVGDDKCKVPNREDITYLNITHEELMKQVSQNFIFTSDIKETSIFYLKEYFKTIETHYSSKQNAPIMSEILSELVFQKENVKELLKKIDEANVFATQAIDSIFQSKNFRNSNGLNNRSKLFFTYNENEALVFAINIDKLLTENILVVHLALFTPLVTTEKIEEIKRKVTFGNSKFKTGSYSGRDHSHLFIYTDNNFLNKNEKFEVRFRELLDNDFFTEGGVFNIALTALKNV